MSYNQHERGGYPLHPRENITAGYSFYQYKMSLSNRKEGVAKSSD